MAIKPILFSTPMVQAILAKRKRQTRRLIKSRHESGMFQVSKTLDGIVTGITSIDWDERPKNDVTNDIKPIAVAGDILWVRETWQTTYNEKTEEWDYIYKADGKLWIDEDGLLRWKPSIFMPKEAARIFLKVTNVRAERLQDISEDDAIAEGIKVSNSGKRYFNYTPRYAEVTQFVYDCHTAKESFKTLWQSINGRESWEDNPWVWVYEFEQIEKPKDFGNE